MTSDNRLLQDFAPLVGRILLATMFIIAGFNKITGFEGTLGFMASQGIPLTSLALVITIIIELGGGLMIAFGVFARWAALVIFLFIIPVNIIFHPFWAVPDEINSFLKNLAVMGGMLYIMAYGSGPYSIKDPGTLRSNSSDYSPAR